MANKSDNTNSNNKRRPRDAGEEETTAVVRTRVRRARDDDAEGDKRMMNHPASTLHKRRHDSATNDEDDWVDESCSDGSDEEEFEGGGDLIVDEDVEEEIIEDDEDDEDDDEAYAEFQRESGATGANAITAALKSVSFADAHLNKTKSSTRHKDDEDDDDAAAASAVMVWRPDQASNYVQSPASPPLSGALDRVAGAAGDGIQLDYSNKAYDCFFQLRTEYPCLSFDVIQDRTSAGGSAAGAGYRARYPLSMMLVCGTQADAMSRNELVILHVSNMHRTKHDVMSDEDSEADSYIGDGGESEEEEEENGYGDAEAKEHDDSLPTSSERAGKKGGTAAEVNHGEPVVRHRVIAHYGTANRVRCSPWMNNSHSHASQDGPQLVAVWSDAGHVQVFDLDHEVRALTDFANWSKEQARLNYSDPASANLNNSNNNSQRSKNKATASTHSSRLSSSEIHHGSGVGDKKSTALRFCTPSSTHKTEGYGLDWSEVQRGVFASGDCDGSLYVWQPSSDGRWCHSASHTRPVHGGVDEVQFGSIEEIQWSPTQAEVLITARAGGVVQVYDTRDMRRHRLAWQADASDINVCDWNRVRQASHLLVTGADSGAVAVWDLRKISTSEPIQRLRWHNKSITSVEFSLHNESVLAVTADDGQCTLWDLSLERDPSEEQEVIGELFGRADLQGIPDQLMFQHQGLNHAKEAHWHVQIPGMVITTDYEGLHLFRPMNWRSLMK